MNLAKNYEDPATPALERNIKVTQNILPKYGAEVLAKAREKHVSPSLRTGAATRKSVTNAYCLV